MQCNATLRSCFRHYPQTKHTAVADTPEISRISKNTKMQSNVSIGGVEKMINPRGVKNVPLQEQTKYMTRKLL